MHEDTSYVNLSLEKYNELYEKAKKYDELYEKYKDKYDELVEKASEILITWLDSLSTNKEVTTTDETVTTETNEEHQSYKFKKGDRVVCISGDNLIDVGDKGTVDENSNIPFVNWDKGIRSPMTSSEIKKLGNKNEEEK